MLSNGNSGTIRIPKKYIQATVVPEIASFEQQGKIYVYKVQNDTAIANMIRVKDRVSNMIVVEEGVKEGEDVIVTGIGSLRNKAAIRVKRAHFDTIVNAIQPVF